jgi:putative oxidoreductase
MTRFGSERMKNEMILIARVFLMALFVVSGWGKLMDYNGTVGYMTQVGAVMPSIAAVVAIVLEFFVAIVIVLGLYTRPLAIVLALYTLATALIGHRYWSMAGPARADNLIHFYKNISIAGGLLLLYVTGAGMYSIEALPGFPRRLQSSQLKRGKE